MRDGSLEHRALILPSADHGDRLFDLERFPTGCTLSRYSYARQKGPGWRGDRCETASCNPAVVAWVPASGIRSSYTARYRLP